MDFCRGVANSQAFNPDPRDRGHVDDNGFYGQFPPAPLHSVPEPGTSAPDAGRMPLAWRALGACAALPGARFKAAAPGPLSSASS